MRRNPSRALSLSAVALLSLVALTGCIPLPGMLGGGAGGSGGGPDLSLPTTETVELTDPVKDSFTVEVPKGWSSVAYATGQFDVHREVVRSISPDGNTILFLTDPKVPNYWNPATANPTTIEFAEQLDYMELQPYTQAADYFAVWTETKFGDLAGFELTALDDDADTVAAMKEAFAAAGMGSFPIHAVLIRFAYTAEDGTPMHGLIAGTTVDGGAFWQADVTGLVTDRSIDDYLPMLRAMAGSKQTKQSYIDAQNAHHEATMAQMDAFWAQMTAQHEANMAAIQLSAQTHQAQMQAIWASNDASIQAWNTQMAASDYNQQQFLNYINDEHTVASPTGQTWQVDDGYQNYYVNTTDNSYVGGDINFDDQDLIAMGLDPDDYQQVEIVNG